MSRIVHAIVVAPPRPAPARRGFTLLEVLVSVGVIVAALAGLAALLPAAGARLGEATAIDRAGTMAANAQADLVTRGVCRAALWSGSSQALVFGEGLSSLTSYWFAPGSVRAADPTVLAQRIDTAAGFRLRDNLQAGSTGVVTGWNPGVCYGCMLSSTFAPTTSGSTARLTTVVFSKVAPAAQGFSLTGNSSSARFQVTGTLSATGAVGSLTAANMADMTATLRKQFLGGCSWVLAVPGPGQSSQEPRWVPIASSWTASGTATGPSYVTFSGNDHVPLIAGGTLYVVGFDGLLRVDERWINLE